MHQIRQLQNGIWVVSEHITHVKSVSIGVWIGNGSRYEDKSVNGISHFIEHMLFKGTNKRSAYQIAWDMDSVGGMINAFTSKEHTCFYTQTLNTHSDLAIDMLSDMLFSSKLDPELMDLERQVILEEISMYDDNPDELVYELINSTAWKKSSLGMPVLGTEETLNSIDSNIMRNYISEHYTSGNTVIAVSGNFDDTLFLNLEEKFGSVNLKKNIIPMPSAEYVPDSIVKNKDIGQVQLIMGFESIDIYDEDVYSLLTINNIFGNGMSSRLFQNIRESRGLAYSIYSSCMAYVGTGMFSVSVGVSPDNLKKVCDLISEEINILKKEKLSESEISMAKEQLKGNFILGYESTGARMQSAGRNLLIGKKILSQEEVINKINKVNKNSVANMIDKIIKPETLCIAAVGAVDSVEGLFNIK